MAAKFHNTMVSVIVETAAALAGETGITRVMLSGGVFQNRFILERSVRLLESGGLSPYSNAIVPANDGGICLGQLAVAAMRSSG